MKRIAGRLLIVGLLLLACGCSSIIHEPKVALREMHLIGLDASGVDMECQRTASHRHPSG